MSAPSQETFDPIETWLQQVAAGDRDAFEALYRATAAMLLGICLRVLPDRAEAEDVLQDVFVIVWSKARQFDPQRARPITWLGAIARHRAIDRLRALPPIDASVGVEAIEAVHDPAPSPAARVETASELSRLNDCLQQLEPTRRQLIRTAFFEHATYAQLAERTGSPLGSVKSWIRRSLQQLRGCLEQ